MNRQKLITQTNIALALISFVLVALAAPSTIAQTRKANGRIAFASNGEGTDGIWTMNPDGSDRRRLTTMPARAPSWSPDGNKIGFLKGSSYPNYEIWFMNSDGENQTSLETPGPIDESAIAWSPEGKSIAFANMAGLFVLKLDGGNAVYIGAGYSPSWSPDGSKLVVTDGQTLRVLQSDGGGATQLWSDQQKNDYDWWPVWSPDGTRIAFTHGVNCDWYGECDSTTLWTVNSDGTDAKQISGLDDEGQDWSPDGKKLVFTSFATAITSS